MKGEVFAALLASVVAHAAIIAALPLAMETSAGEDGSSAEIRLLGLVEMAAASETPVPSAPAAPVDPSGPPADPAPPSPEEGRRPEPAPMEPCVHRAEEVPAPEQTDAETVPEEPRPAAEAVRPPQAAGDPAAGAPPSPPVSAPPSEEASAGGVGAPGDSERSRGAADARSRYLAGVLRRIHAAKRYPQRARRNRIEGRATVTFTIEADGSVSAASLSSSSGDDLLDAEALRIVDRAAPFDSIPEELGRKTWKLEVPIVFELRGPR